MTRTLARASAGQAAPAPGEPPITRLTLGRTLAELVLGGLLAVVLSLALTFAASRIGTDPGTNVPTALVSLACAVILAVCFGLIAFGWARRWPSWVKVVGAWAALSAFATLLLAIPLQATRFYLGGSSVDNTFRLQYMERMTAGGGLADMNYHGLAPYYPGAWFWLGGRFANLLGWDGWAAYKPYSILWVAFAAVVAFVLWSLVVGRRLALLATVATVLVAVITVVVDEPYAWPTTAWLPPIAVLAWSVFRRRQVPKWPIVLIGVYLGIAAMTYTLHAAFGVAVVVLLAIVAGVVQARRGEAVGPTVKRLFLRLAGMGVLTLLLALVTWAPFILAGGLGEPNVAAHFLPESSAVFPTPFESTSVSGVLCLAGLVWLIVRARREPIAFSLLTVVALVYAWFVVSTLALLVRTTLLAFRFVGTLQTVLAVAGVFAAVELLRAVPKLVRNARPVLIAGVVLALAGAVSLTQTAVTSSLKPQVQNAESDYYADGHNAKGEHDTSQDGAWTGALISTIDQLSGRPRTGNIVLSAYDRLLSFAPYWGFQQTTPQYANPLGEYDKRNAELRGWAASADAAQLIQRLDTGPYEAPNVFVFRRVEGKLVAYAASDAFPREVPLHVDEVSFDPVLFDSARFTRRDVGPFTVIIRLG
ncbi:arabinofuranosyltransferase [Amycolatopsis sp. K13G38]|uniref:Galactan 5-O-arabinofuranosyltransferase n=1 Tax=Amycolatopsis acididurans TaxID=2724524 RepID=A0ABX1J1J2_9PSEU|nr:arabinofuranosyltransferase [Amycolatopsis acididurans]NKQ53504.1 arabinofuranosyltransferase [Amycolatopsis acididurans]